MFSRAGRVGAVVCQEGVNKDLTELKASEAKRKSVFEAMECLSSAARVAMGKAWEIPPRQRCFHGFSNI